MITIKQIAAEFCQERGMPLEELKVRSRAHRYARPRQEFMREATRRGKSQSAVARFLGLHPSTVCKPVKHKEAGR